MPLRERIDGMRCVMTTIMDVVKLASEIRHHWYLDENLEETSPVLEGLASGLDTGFTLLEASLGAFSGLSPDAARSIADYFDQEAERLRDSNRQVSIWYESYAAAVIQLFIQDPEEQSLPGSSA